MRVTAPAKLNLTLEVLGRREDGYHEVRTVLQTIDLADQLEITADSTLRVECDDPALAGESNLVWQAAQALARRGGRQPQARIRIEKKIPVSMGLGGGSSDAGAVLPALNRFWDLDLPLTDLADVAASLGSDVPYFLWGGAALARGRGELVEPLPSLTGAAALLVCPADTLEGKTGQLYGRLRPYHYSDGGVTRRMVENLLAGQYAEDLTYNVFEEVAFEAFPRLEGLRRRIWEITGRRPNLSGAGPALFLLPAAEEDYLRVAGVLPPGQAKAYFVRTVGRRSLRTWAGASDLSEGSGNT